MIVLEKNNILFIRLFLVSFELRGFDKVFDKDFDRILRKILYKILATII